MAQALALLARVLRDLGEIAVEDPGSRGSRDELVYWGLRPVPVPVDERGLRVDDLARGDLRAVLLTPAHQFPTGVVLSAAWGTRDRSGIRRAPPDQLHEAVRRIAQVLSG